MNTEKEIISVTEKDGVQMVSARDLHEKLESSERFSKWWERFSNYGFVENEDYYRWCTKKYAPINQFSTEMQEIKIGDYQITIEMAKQICMLQRSAKGKQYREYFLKLERAWNTPEAVMSRALQIANQTLEKAKNKIKLLEPKAQVYDDFISRDKFCNFRDGANYIGVTQSVFMDFLKSRYIYKNSIGEYRAYSEYADYFTLRPYQKGTEKTGQQLMLNLKGLEYFKAKISA